jgi:hypothetical protein
MAKKRVRKSSTRRAPVVSKHKYSERPVRMAPEKRRVKLVLKNLILFLALFVISTIFLSLSTKETISYNLFLILTILMGFVSVALLIVLLILLFMRAIRK